MAKRGWNHAEGASRPTVRGTQPNGPGKKTEASGTFWSTGVGSRCRSASPGPTGMMSRSSRRCWTPSCANRGYSGQPALDAVTERGYHPRIRQKGKARRGRPPKHRR